MSHAIRTLSASKVIAPELLLEIAAWRVKTMTPFIKFARDPDVTAIESDVWEHTWNLIYLISAEQLEMSSSLATDNLAWIWAHTVKIFWLDADYKEIEETISMHATDWTIAVTTVNSYLRVYRMSIITAWSSEKALWTISLKDSLTNTQALVVDWNNQTLMSQYTIPAWKTAFLIYWDSSVWEWKSAVGKFYMRVLWEVFRVVQIIDLFETNYVRNFKLPISIPEKTDLTFRASSASAWTAMSINYDLVLIDNE